jgi:hypothetical protein
MKQKARLEEIDEGLIIKATGVPHLLRIGRKAA